MYQRQLAEMLSLSTQQRQRDEMIAAERKHVLAGHQQFFLRVLMI